MENWKILLNSLESGIEKWKLTKDTSAIVDNLDRVFDEIKSGSEIPKDESILGKIFNLFSQIMDFDVWAFKATVLFALIHIYHSLRNEPKRLENYLGIGSQNNSLFLKIVSHISNKKRELRDAVAQNFGFLCNVLGDHFLFVNLIPEINILLEKFDKKAYEAFEGTMMTLGFATSRCKNLSLQTLISVFDLLLSKGAVNTTFESYSGYIRSQSLRAISRILQNNLKIKEYYRIVAGFSNAQDNLSTEELEKLKNLFENIDTMLKTKRINDGDMDVRRKNAVALSFWFEIQIQTFGLAHNDEETSKFIENQIIFPLLDKIPTIPANNKIYTWESAHCIGETLARLFADAERSNLFKIANEWLLGQFLSFVNDSKASPIFQKIFEALSKNALKLQPEKSHYPANASTGKALAQIFVAALKASRTSKTYPSSEKLPSFQKCFETLIVPHILSMSKFGNANLLDEACNSLLLVICEAHELFDEKTKTEKSFALLKTMLSHLLKNRFHASYPIRNSARVLFRKARQLLYGTQDAISVFHKLGELSENEKQHKELGDFFFDKEMLSLFLKALIQESDIKDYEVRDAVFKTFDFIFEWISRNYSQNAVTFSIDEKTFQKLFETLQKQALCEPIGQFPEIPQSSAIKSIGNYLKCLGLISKNKKYLSKTFKSWIEACGKKLLNSEETLILKSTLECLKKAIFEASFLIGQDFAVEILKYVFEELPQVVAKCLVFTKTVSMEEVKFAALHLSVLFSVCYLETLNDYSLANKKDSSSPIYHYQNMLSFDPDFWVKHLVLDVFAKKKEVWGEDEIEEDNLWCIDEDCDEERCEAISKFLSDFVAIVGIPSNRKTTGSALSESEMCKLIEFLGKALLLENMRESQTHLKNIILFFYFCLDRYKQFSGVASKKHQTILKWILHYLYFLWKTDKPGKDYKNFFDASKIELFFPEEEETTSEPEDEEDEDSGKKTKKEDSEDEDSEGKKEESKELPAPEAEFPQPDFAKIENPQKTPKKAESKLLQLIYLMLSNALDLKTQEKVQFGIQNSMQMQGNVTESFSMDNLTEEIELWDNVAEEIDIYEDTFDRIEPSQEYRIGNHFLRMKSSSNQGFGKMWEVLSPVWKENNILENCIEKSLKTTDDLVKSVKKLLGLIKKGEADDEDNEENEDMDVEKEEEDEDMKEEDEDENDFKVVMMKRAIFHRISQLSTEESEHMKSITAFSSLFDELTNIITFKNLKVVEENVDEKLGDSLNYVWSCRLLEILFLKIFQGTEKSETAVNTIFNERLKEPASRDKNSNRALMAILCLICAGLSVFRENKFQNLNSNSEWFNFIQLLSNVWHNEDLVEEKDTLALGLSRIEKRMFVDLKKPLVLPEPDLSVAAHSNSTFSKNQ